MRNWLKQIPLAANAYKKINMFARNNSNASIIERLGELELGKAGEIREVLLRSQQPLAEFEQRWIDQIEQQRERLLKCRTSLNDGSLGRAGLYDDNVSIRDACLVSKPPAPGRLLFLLAQSVKPLNVIELGTNVGLSSAFIGAGLKAGGGEGRLFTLDASPYRQRLAREVHQAIRLDNVNYIEGLFSETLSSALSQMGTVDLAFIDGHHQYQPTLDYFEEILKCSTPNTIFVFDDIRWSDGMKKAWERIQLDDRLGVVVDLSSVGICTRQHDAKRNRYVSDPIYLF
ncbi:O-methyltransferase [Corallincola luteus]|nr:class I SAM-dependent methyltransferase [Corallincola luteus]